VPVQSRLSRRSRLSRHYSRPRTGRRDGGRVGNAAAEGAVLSCDLGDGRVAPSPLVGVTPTRSSRSRPRRRLSKTATCPSASAARRRGRLHGRALLAAPGQRPKYDFRPLLAHRLPRSDGRARLPHLRRQGGGLFVARKVVGLDAPTRTLGIVGKTARRRSASAGPPATGGFVGRLGIVPSSSRAGDSVRGALGGLALRFRAPRRRRAARRGKQEHRGRRPQR
jgi:hypothetical protein